MKPHVAERKQASRVRVVYARSGRELEDIKRKALMASASARPQAVSDVREAFGFMPVNLKKAVIHWPAL